MKTETFTILNKVYGLPCKLLVRYMDQCKSTEWLLVTEEVYLKTSLGSIGTVKNGKLDVLRQIIL